MRINTQAAEVASARRTTSNTWHGSIVQWNWCCWRLLFTVKFKSFFAKHHKYWVNDLITCSVRVLTADANAIERIKFWRGYKRNGAGRNVTAWTSKRCASFRFVSFHFFLFVRNESRSTPWWAHNKNVQISWDLFSPAVDIENDWAICQLKYGFSFRLTVEHSYNWWGVYFETTKWKMPFTNVVCVEWMGFTLRWQSALEKFISSPSINWMLCNLLQSISKWCGGRVRGRAVSFLLLCRKRRVPIGMVDFAFERI